jgi:hypothetical protein
MKTVGFYKYPTWIKDDMRRLRERAVELLGAACAHCGFTDIRALQIDHRAGNGAQERKIMSQRQTYQRVFEHTEDYQVLCANCNWIKRAENGEHAWKNR